MAASNFVGGRLLATCLRLPRVSTADMASDHPAAILVFPKLIVDTANGLDTVVRISNVSDTPINVYCFYVNATPQVLLRRTATSAFRIERRLPRDIGGRATGGTCIPKWQETDFHHSV